MNETILFCRYENRDEALVAYLYEDIAPADRAAFDAHLATCERCRLELAELRGVRTELAGWAPPEFAPLAHAGLRGRKPGVWAAIAALPAWAQTAAALLVLGASLGLANLDIRYEHGNLTVHTGWMRQAPAPGEAAAAKTLPATQVVAAPVSSPWRDDLADLARQLRAEMHSAQPSAPAVVRTSTSDAEVLRRVRALVDESERRQQNELALRIAQVVNDVSAQRQADLRNISHSLGQLQNNTGVEVARQQQMLNYLMRVSQTAAPAPK